MPSLLNLPTLLLDATSADADLIAYLKMVVGALCAVVVVLAQRLVAVVQKHDKEKSAMIRAREDELRVIRGLPPASQLSGDSHG
jgi:hypothetical protein